MKSALISLLAAIVVALPAFAADAADPAPAPGADRSALDGEVQSLRRDVVDLNRDLFMLEEDLLFPASTQVAVFVSMDVGTFFALDSVQLKVDDKEVANYLYTEREQDALKRGGVQRLWLGNLKAGDHEVTARGYRPVPIRNWHGPRPHRTRDHPVRALRRAVHLRTLRSSSTPTPPSTSSAKTPKSRSHVA